MVAQSRIAILLPFWFTSMIMEPKNDFTNDLVQSFLIAVESTTTIITLLPIIIRLWTQCLVLNLTFLLGTIRHHAITGPSTSKTTPTVNEFTKTAKMKTTLVSTRLKPLHTRLLAATLLCALASPIKSEPLSRLGSSRFRSTPARSNLSMAFHRSFPSTGISSSQDGQPKITFKRPPFLCHMIWKVPKLQQVPFATSIFGCDKSQTTNEPSPRSVSYRSKQQTPLFNLTAPNPELPLNRSPLWQLSSSEHHGYSEPAHTTMFSTINLHCRDIFVRTSTPTHILTNPHRAHRLISSNHECLGANKNITNTDTSGDNLAGGIFSSQLTHVLKDLLAGGIFPPIINFVVALPHDVWSLINTGYAHLGARKDILPNTTFGIIATIDGIFPSDATNFHPKHPNTITNPKNDADADIVAQQQPDREPPDRHKYLRQRSSFGKLTSEPAFHLSSTTKQQVLKHDELNNNFHRSRCAHYQPDQSSMRATAGRNRGSGDIYKSPSITPDTAIPQRRAFDSNDANIMDSKL